MEFYSREEAIERLNVLGAQDRPFIFVVDFSMEKSYISLLEDVNPDEVLFSFPSWNNNMNIYYDNQREDANHNSKDNCKLKDIKWEVMAETAEVYRRKFDIIQNSQRAGDCFLANLTCQIPIHSNLSLLDVYLHSKAKYKLWFKSHFVCFSPEIFVRIEDGLISGYPMKGTIDASLPNAEKMLMKDKKEAAEHATIVDLIRNDLSQVASQVCVPCYRYVDLLHTNKGDILQTSSRIEGKLPEDYRSHIGDILFSQLPAGSITGAPKRKTVEIIREAEDYDRGFYTGVMGIYCAGKMESAVMIRYIEQQGEKLFFKAGGGITAQSQWKSEYEEVIQKAYVPIY